MRQSRGIKQPSAAAQLAHKETGRIIPRLGQRHPQHCAKTKERGRTAFVPCHYFMAGIGWQRSEQLRQRGLRCLRLFHGSPHGGKGMAPPRIG